jgi:biotin synthase
MERLFMLESIWDKIDRSVPLSKDEAVELLNISNISNDFYKLIAKANELSRKQYDNKGYIFAQIGINAAPCSGNCKFCSLAENNYSVDGQFEKSIDEIVSQAKMIADKNIEALFLMTTADFAKDKFLTIGKSVRAVLPDKIQLIANIGDFDSEYAERLKAIGFSGAYHIVRLREGVDTEIKKETRINTLNSIKSAGLDLYY